jgi:hypothetical protein
VNIGAPWPDLYEAELRVHAMQAKLDQWAVSSPDRLEAAYAAHPERFVRKPPTPPAMPTVAWINQRGQHSAGTVFP